MSEALLGHEPVVRGGAFAVVLAAMLAWEWAAPRRARSVPRLGRWLANFGLVAIDTLLLRLLLPAAAVVAAAVAAERGWGLLHVLDVPPAPAAVAAVLVLDLALWAQHLATHKLPLLWRLHRVHHSDVDLDATSGVRFHPVEILLSMLYKVAVVVALGAPVAAVIVFEILLNASSLFNHGNVRLPAAVDRVLRALLVTPDMHRVHHSVHRDETDSNYGFTLSVWDRLFGTYRAQPRDGHGAMTIGLAEFRDPPDRRLDRLLLQPLQAAGHVDAAAEREGR